MKYGFKVEMTKRKANMRLDGGSGGLSHEDKAMYMCEPT